MSNPIRDEEVETLTITEPDTSPSPEDDTPPSALRPLSALPALAVMVILALVCKGFIFGGGGGDVRAAANAHHGSSNKPSAAVAAPHKDTPAPARNVPLRPPPSDACVTNEWCGKALGYASVIVDVGRRTTNLPKRALYIAVATAMQESSLQNEATEAYPETKSLPYDIIGGDHDSVGLFQQRPSQGWGTPAELMNPRVASAKFYGKLQKVVSGWKDWEDPAKVRLTDVAQTAQNSGTPDAYQKREAGAIKVVDYVLQFVYAGPVVGTTAQSDWFVMVRCKDPHSGNCQSAPYQLVNPVVANRDAFIKYYPAATFHGELGDKHHQGDDPTTNDEPLQDHTPVGHSCVDGKCNGYGWVYAQDFGMGGGFDLGKFFPWFLDQLRAGKYPEVKYVICTYPPNKGVAGGKYYGYFDRRNGWQAESASDHDTHAHASYMPGFERAGSAIIEDFHKSIGA